MVSASGVFAWLLPTVLSCKTAPVESESGNGKDALEIIHSIIEAQSFSYIRLALRLRC